MPTLLDRLLTPLLDKLDGWKTLIGLAGLLATWLIRQFAPDKLDADTANTLWWSFAGLSGLGVAAKEAKRITKPK